jgi:hypothetical protein
MKRDCKLSPRVVAAALACLAMSSAAMADDDDGDAHRSRSALVGSWRVTITPYNCATGVEATQFAFESMLSFGKGGTVVETTSNANFEPGQRSIGLGNWERSSRNAYYMVVEAFIQFTLPSAPQPPRPYYQRGRQVLSQGIEMQNSDLWTSTGTVTFLNFAGAPAVSPPPGCAKAVGRRIE